MSQNSGLSRTQADLGRLPTLQSLKKQRPTMLRQRRRVSTHVASRELTQLPGRVATLKTLTQSAPHPLSTSVVPMIRSIPHPQFSGFLVARARRFVIIHLVLLPSPGTPTQVASREPKHSPGWEQSSISFNAHAANTGAIATLTQLLFPS